MKGARSARFLAVDIGNSSVKASRWEGAWSEPVRWPSAGANVEVWIRRFAPLADGVRRAGVASVVPSATAAVCDAVAALTGSAPTVVSAALPLPFRMAYATPHTLGADRLAAAVAAHALAEGRPVVALDAGSAITTEAITAEPAYLGGAILPGPDLLRRALTRDTGQLPDVAWRGLATAIGNSTESAIQAGLAALLVDGVGGLVRRTRAQLGGEPRVIATGGQGAALARLLPEIDRVEPMLVLEGVRLLSR